MRRRSGATPCPITNITATTMVMATHDLRLASRVADHVVFLDAGVVVESGAPKDIFQTPERERTKRFIASLNTAVSYDI